MDLLVKPDWLAANLSRDDIKILDGTWVLPDEAANLAQGYIPGTQVFNIDAIADLNSDMKHMLASARDFASAMSKMGIANSDHVICYDRHGLFSSPRVWWTFMTFGHNRVSILDGGLPAWLNAGYDMQKAPSPAKYKTVFKTGASLIGVTDKKSVLSMVSTNTQIIDARPSGRFFGTSPEPREGLRSGRIPGSISLPFGTLKTSEGFFRPMNEIATIAGEAGIDLEKPIITSCGSGITAAGIAFILHRLGAKNLSLYDGSWVEWGASDAPIEV